jgi:uncharacterized protein
MEVAGFIGLTERGPVCVPVVIDSWDAFLREFGRPGGGRQLPECVHHFFLNGGRRCVVVRAMSSASTCAAGSWDALRSAGVPLAYQARNPGRWANQLRGHIDLHSRPLSASVSAQTASNYLWTHEPSVVPGSLLRCTARHRRDGDLHEKLVFVTEVAQEDSGASRLVLDKRLESPWVESDPDQPSINRLEGRIEVITAEVSARVGRSGFFEEFDTLGLHPEHPRFLPRVLAQESRLVRPVVPAGPLEPDFNELGAFAPRQAGTEAARETVREDFFRAPAPAAGDPRQGRPAPLEALLRYENGSGVGERVPQEYSLQLNPISLVAMPDLAHPPQPAFGSLPETAEQEVDDEDPLRFRPCRQAQAQDAGTEERAEPVGYPKLAIGAGAGELVDYQRRLVEWCENHGYSIAVLALAPRASSTDVVQTRSALRSEHAALYGPWIEAAPANDRLGPLQMLPPVGAVCGVVARAEASGGPAAPPANIALEGIVSLVDQELMDPGFLHRERVNLVRQEATDIRVMGSRTTGGDEHSGHLSVQRVLHFLGRQLPIDARWAAFEPNDHRLWRRLKNSLEDRLFRLHRQNALRGASAEQAYFVRCDATTNPAKVRDQGRVVALVGVALAVPSEFIHLQLALLNNGRIALEEAR